MIMVIIIPEVRALRAAGRSPNPSANREGEGKRGASRERYRDQRVVACGEFVSMTVSSLRMNERRERERERGMKRAVTRRDSRNGSRDVYLSSFRSRDIPLRVQTELSPGRRLIFRIDE